MRIMLTHHLRDCVNWRVKLGTDTTFSSPSCEVCVVVLILTGSGNIPSVPNFQFPVSVRRTTVAVMDGCKMGKL